ncbi:hypothetical protein DL93DRAFT_1296421 [Clavulina sp. PMI_390]|nr:hypothetical protein DL93DRAFT_1296421 [Clavulina sp. PMI_390]
MTLLCRIFPRLSRRPAVPTSVVQQRVTIKDLPVEILLMIVAHISRWGIRSLAQVDHEFNSFLTRRLWTSVKINFIRDCGSTYKTFARFFQFAARDGKQPRQLDPTPFRGVLPEVRHLSCSLDWAAKFAMQERHLQSLTVNITPYILQEAAQYLDRPSSLGTTSADLVRVCMTGESGPLHLIPQVIELDVGVKLRTVRTLIVEARRSPPTLSIAEAISSNSLPSLERLE